MTNLFIKFLRRLLHKKGWRLVKRPTFQEITPLKQATDAVYAHKDIAFEIPLDHCVYPYGFAYGANAWHPFVKTLEQYKNERTLSYERSILHTYYQNFQPKTVLDVFFTQQDQDLHDSSLANLHIPPHLPTFPWDPQVLHFKGEKGLGAAHGSQGYGPVSVERGQEEFQRLVQTFLSIEANGYKPQNNDDGDIKGYFLKAEDDYRFIVRQGLHRTAALAALGHENIRVRFYQHYPRLIHLRDVLEWPQVKNKHIKANIAKRVFYCFFDDNGTQKARDLELL